MVKFKNRKKRQLLGLKRAYGSKSGEYGFKAFYVLADLD